MWCRGSSGPTLLPRLTGRWLKDFGAPTLARPRSPRHQVLVLALARRLQDASPASLQALIAPVDVRIDDATVLQPDVLIVPRSEVGERFVRHPVLAVEVRSPSTRSIDLTCKKARYERAGCASYWVVDPVGRSLTAWDLVEGRYVQVAYAVSPDELSLVNPVQVRVPLADLLA
ncbi:MAG: Uma2 family endonuclease [Ornithinimicrobium sp.]|uniref:Uma2 family endonuclease n=1 Tax=Ornithinimicrobium sp. TaxID=1977084 RepID=UPI003D9ADCEF